MRKVSMAEYRDRVKEVKKVKDGNREIMARV